jgi:hypothetical protein
VSRHEALAGALPSGVRVIVPAAKGPPMWKGASCIRSLEQTQAVRAMRRRRGVFSVRERSLR